MRRPTKPTKAKQRSAKEKRDKAVLPGEFSGYAVSLLLVPLLNVIYALKSLELFVRGHILIAFDHTAHCIHCGTPGKAGTG